MKKISTLFLILFMAISYKSYSQIEVIPTLADYGLETIENVFPSEFTNPEILLIGTVKYTLINEQIGELNIAFDEETGKSTAWVYMFRSADNHDDIRAWGVGKVTQSGYEMAVPFAFPDSVLTVMIDLLPFEIGNVISAEYEGINSDEMIEKVKVHASYTDFMTTHEEAKVVLAAMGNTTIPGQENESPAWAVVVTDDTDTLKLFIDATTGAVTDPNSSVYENVNNAAYKISVYPNPIEETATVVIPTEIFNQDATLKLYDSFGREVAGFEHNDLGANTTVTLNSVASGVYFLKYGYGEKAQIVPVTVK